MAINGTCVITTPVDNGFEVPVKWKPRGVSAVRDFPPGCGPIVQLVDNGVNDAGIQGARGVESFLPLQNGDHQLALKEVVQTQGTENGGGSVMEDMQNGDDQVALKEVVQTQGMENGGGSVMKDMQNGDHQVTLKEVVQTQGMENGGGSVMEDMQNGDRQVALKEVVQTQGMENGGGSVMEDMQNGDRQVALKEVVQTQGMEDGGGSVMEDMQNGDSQAVEVDDVQMLPVNETENGGIAVEENTQKMKFPRRRVSAVRDFPPYCGLNATEPTEEERKRINGSSYVGLTEAMVLDGEGSNKDGKSSNGTQKEESKMNVKDIKVHVIDEPSQELVAYTKDKAVSRICSDDDEDQRNDINIEEMLNRSVALVQNDIKNVTGQKSGHEKHLHKRPLDDDSRYLVIGLQVSDDEKDHQNDFKGQKMVVKNSDSQKVGHDASLKKQKVGRDASLKKQKVGHDKCIFRKPLDIRPRPLVCGLQAKSLCAEGSAKLVLTNVDDSKKAKATGSASVTPKLVVKKSHKKQVKVFGESSGAGNAAVPYTGTLEMVVREEENIVAKTEEREDRFFNSYGPGPIHFEVTLPPVVRNRSSSDARNKVREILRYYHSTCRKIIRGEESKTEVLAGYQKNRVDLKAKTIMEKEGKLMALGPRQCGSVPGVEVGDEFQYRVELALVGIHRPYQAGIDMVKQGNDVFAVSIVASGGYDNEVDKPDCLIYSGAGGVTKEKTIEDQKLERGNLALYNNIAAKLPVRVVRGWKSSETSDTASKSKIMTTYIYDGLYMVNDYKRETGPKGNFVYKFELYRIPGQPELAIREVKSKKFRTKREGVCAKDISDGKESFRICAINTIDDETPPSFTYITKIMYPDWYRPVLPKGCTCVGRCTDKKCECSFKNGGEIPYNHNGAIVEAKPLVYECGPSCGCPPSCYNRVTQNGIKLKLEIFKTESRGWGVRSLSSILSGSFICEYIGELLEDTEAEKRTGNDEYLFDIGQKCSDSLYPDESGEMVDKTGFTIDALHYGNVGRFINHSCTPNLYAQNVMFDQEDTRIPHIMLFAAENIPPLQELTYHYNYAVNTVHDADGNIKIKNCYCGSSECTGRLY